MNIMEFARMLVDGSFLIPAFQRDFIWEQQNIINLWDSIFHFYPIGNILYWDTDIHLNIHRKLGKHVVLSRNLDLMKSNGRMAYILDGQQRATALLLSLSGGEGKTKDLRTFDYALYFDAVNTVFFPAEEFNRRSLDINPTFLVRLGDVCKWPADFHEQVKAEPGFKRKIGANLRQLGRVFEDYKILLTRISGFDIKGVCEIFERINQEGMRLKNMDLIISRSFHNYECVTEEWV
jgi:hypothetical protein